MAETQSGWGRESDKYFYLFINNPAYYDAKEDTVIVARKYRQAFDLGGNYAFPIKTKTSGDSTSFDLRLAPGEGTVIRLEKWKKP